MSTIGVIKQTSSKATDLPRVLVVEDDADTLVFLGKLLSTIPVDGIPTATCAAARYALKALGKCNIVIADRHLPDGDGVEMLQQFNLEHGCTTVVMSGDPPPDDGLPEGIDLWLVKPIYFSQLTDAVATLCPAA